MGVPGVHKVVYLVLFFFTLRTLTERDGHPIVLIYISSPVVIKSMRKWDNDRIDEWAKDLVVVDPIEVVVDVLEGPEGDSSEILEILVIVGEGGVEQNGLYLLLGPLQEGLQLVHWIYFRIHHWIEYFIEQHKYCHLNHNPTFSLSFYSQIPASGNILNGVI